jgi:hypothetical protein
VNALPSDASLFTGGIVSRLLRGMGLQGAASERVRTASILIVPAVAWLPLFALSAIGGSLLNRSLGMPFLHDLGAHIRLLIVLPLLLLAGRVAERRIRPTIEQFVSHFLIPDDMIGKFDAATASAYRLGNSVVADVLTVVLIIVASSALVWHTYAGRDTSSWYATSSLGSGLTPAGTWYFYVSLPIFQFILLRWYFRLLIWARFLAQVAKLNLRLVPTHPDRVGGLGFLVLATQSLSLFAMAHGALLAGWLANRILIRNAHLPDFKLEIVAVVIFVLCITTAPLFAFTAPLIVAKRRGVLEYGALASRYVCEFDAKWVRPGVARNEDLVGSADVQSLADMGGSYELVRNMRILPITPQMIGLFIIATLLPVFPLVLTEIPLSELMRKLVSILV